MRVRSSVWWPNISSQVTEMVKKCPKCAKMAIQRKEPMIVSPLPEFPWKVIGTDLFELDKKHYLLVVDYFSRYPEVILLKSTTSASVIEALKAIFSRHGIPEVIRSDNGPQYSSMEFSKLASSYEFQHITSSPLYPQSNGQAEQTVHTVKRLLKQSDDPYLALMSYRATPLTWCSFSPAELLMGRRIRTPVPQTNQQLIPQWPHLSEFWRLNKLYKRKQKRFFDHGHRVRELPALPNDTEVWIDTDTEPISGTIISTADTPRSYVVQTPTAEVRRNRCQLRIRPEPTDTEEQDSPSQPTPQEASPNVIMTRSRTGTTVYPPERLA